MSNIKASVIIPNYNGEELLKDCLTSLAWQSFKDFEIILVDNGSSDKSLEYVRSNFPAVRIIQLNKNYGFARAINKGVKQSLSQYVVFLNNDTSCSREWLGNLVKCADKHPEVISVNSKLLNFHQQNIIDGAGVLINEVGQAKSVGWQEQDYGQYDTEQYIFGATGGASLFRKKGFMKIGMFDESYFMYLEEVDFAFRAQFLKYQSIYCPRAVVYHKHKATSRKKPQHIEYWQFRNMTLTIIKDFPSFVLFKKWRWLKIIAVHLNTIFYQFKNGFYWAPILADLWILFHLPELLIKRGKIQSNIKADKNDIESFLKEKRITFWGWR